jgi:LPXTG-site transpeptidase (sortase) family protein
LNKKKEDYMNQILVTEKLYITPELKRKKKMYKLNFIISIILITILFSFYAYAEYDRNKNEDISKDILAGMTVKQNTVVNDDTIINSDNEAWIISLDGSGDIVNLPEDPQPQTTTLTGTYTASNGRTYNTIGSINIPSIGVNYPILAETTDNLLKVSVCRFWGGNANEVGNLCIAGHNYRNNRFFSKVLTLKVGDIIEITDLNNQTIKYSVYDKYTVDPKDRSCTSQVTNGKKIVTLITCTNDSKQRVIVQAEEI